MKSTPIVVVGYNRDASLSRLLKSLSEARYDDPDVPLIISLDQSDNRKVIEIAQEYDWRYGKKHVRTHDVQLGLKKHVMECGNISLEYGSVIVLEDDLYVSRNFYRFATEAMRKYGNNDAIAGISLYSHLWNVNCSRPFIPADDGKDAYFLQFAQSWGQAWTGTMWKGFMEWYGNNSGVMSPESDIPTNVALWPDSSWLKYYIRYIVKTNRTFVYPRSSLTTNFGDRGENWGGSSPSFQVPLMCGNKTRYDFPDFDDDSVKYDVFFERVGIGKLYGVPEEDLCTDLYGNKNNRQNRRYWITLSKADFKPQHKYGLKMRPHELNIYHDVAGDDITCYDTSRYVRSANRRTVINRLHANVLSYDLRQTKRTDIWAFGLVHFGRMAVNLFNRLRRVKGKL